MIFINQELSQKLERTEGLCNRAFVETRAKMQPASGADWMAATGALAMFDGIESPLTQTFGVGVFKPMTNENLDEIENFFHTRGAPIFHEISPLADVSTLPLLNERGYQPIELTSVMFRRVEPKNNFAAALNPKIKTRIITGEEANLWAQTSRLGWNSDAPELADFIFEMALISAQSMLPFVAEIDDFPIATGALFVNGDTALLAGASTVPAHRGQGAQAALLDARLRHAAEHGCKIAIMGAAPGSQSQRNAEKNDFRIAYTRTKWQLKR